MPRPEAISCKSMPSTCRRMNTPGTCRAFRREFAERTRESHASRNRSVTMPQGCEIGTLGSDPAADVEAAEFLFQYANRHRIHEAAQSRGFLQSVHLRRPGGKPLGQIIVVRALSEYRRKRPYTMVRNETRFRAEPRPDLRRLPAPEWRRRHRTRALLKGLFRSVGARIFREQRQGVKTAAVDGPVGHRSYSSRVCDTQAHWAVSDASYTPQCRDAARRLRNLI